MKTEESRRAELAWCSWCGFNANWEVCERGLKLIRERFPGGIPSWLGVNDLAITVILESLA